MCLPLFCVRRYRVEATSTVCFRKASTRGRPWWFGRLKASVAKPTRRLRRWKLSRLRSFDPIDTVSGHLVNKTAQGVRHRIAPYESALAPCPFEDASMDHLVRFTVMKLTRGLIHRQLTGPCPSLEGDLETVGEVGSGIWIQVAVPALEIPGLTGNDRYAYRRCWSVI